VKSDGRAGARHRVAATITTDTTAAAPTAITRDRRTAAAYQRGPAARAASLTAPARFASMGG